MGKKLTGKYLQTANETAQKMLDDGFSDEEINQFSKDYLNQFGTDDSTHDIKKKVDTTSADGSQSESRTTSPQPTSNSSGLKKASLLDFLPKEYQSPELAAKAENIIKTNRPEDAFKKLSNLKAETDIENGAPDTRKKSMGQVLADNAIIKTNPNLDFNAQVTNAYNGELNKELGDPGTNSVWLNPPKEVSERAKKNAMASVMQSEAFQRINNFNQKTEKIGSEVAANIERFGQFIDQYPIPESVSSYLKSKKTILADQIDNPSTNPFFMEQYSKMKKQMIDLEREKNLPELKYVQKKVKTADGYDTVMEPTQESIAKRNEVSAKYDQMKSEHDEEFKPIAKIKAASTAIIKGVSDNKMPSTQEIGRIALRAIGDADLETAIKLEQEGVPLTPKMQYELDRAGEDAARNLIAMYTPLAKQGDEAAKDMVSVANYLIADPNGILKRNPKYVKEQVVNLLSDEIAKNPEKYYGAEGILGKDIADGVKVIPGVSSYEVVQTQILKNLGLYNVTDNMILKAAKNLEIPSDYLSGITDEDIKTGNIVGAAVSGLIGDPMTSASSFIERKRNQWEKGYSEEAAAELANRWSEKDAFFRQFYNVPTADELQQGSTIINTQKGSDYLSDIPNPNAGKYNWGAASILNTIGYGAGQMYGLGKGGILLGEGMTDLKLLSKASKTADNVGMFTYGYVTGYERNYQTGLEKFKGQENAGTKAAVYANVFSFIENAMEQQFMPETGLVRSIESPATKSAVDLVNKIVSKGSSALDKKTVKEGMKTIAKGLLETSKGVLEESSEEWATNIGGLAAEVMLGANKDPNYNFVKEQIDTGIQTALQSIIPIGLGQLRLKSPLRDNLVHHIATNPEVVINAIKEAESTGKIDNATANKRIQAVNELVHLDKNVPSSDPASGRKLSTEEHVQFLNDSYKIALAEKEIKNANGNDAVKNRLTPIIEEAKKRQSQILESPAPVNTIEMDVDNTVLPKSESTVSEIIQKEETAPAPDIIIPSRTNDLINKTFTDEEKAKYQSLDPTSKEAQEMVANKRNELAAAKLDALNNKANTRKNAEVGSGSEASGKVDATAETAPIDEIKVGEMVDKVGTYKGGKGRFYQDGQSVVFKVDGQNKEYELGNINEIKDTPISSFSISHEESVVNLNDVGNIVVRGEEYKNNYSDPTQAINRDKDGNVVSVNLETPDGKKRTFRGNIAEDIAYQIHLKEITKDDGTKSEFEQFINEGEVSKEMDNRGLSETPKTTTVENNEAVSREKIEPIVKSESKPTNSSEPSSKVSSGQREESILKSDVDLKGDKKMSWMRKNSLDKISVNDINEEGHNNTLSSAKENVKAGKKSQTREAPLVEIDKNGNATIIDGHHRIAEDILNGKSHIEAVVDNKFDIRDAIKDRLYEKAISEGRMTVSDAKSIIESAGLEVPKDIAKQTTQEVKPNEPIVEQSKAESKVSFEAKNNDNLGTPEVVVKNSDGEVIGNVTTSFDPKNENVLIVQSIDVKPGNQNKGIGKQLYLELAKNNPDKTIKSSPRLSGEYAIKAWESLVRDGIAEKVGENKYEINSKKEVPDSSSLVIEKVTELEKIMAEKGVKIRNLKKQKLDIKLPTLKQIAYSDNPIENKEIYDSLKRRLSLLDEIINCL